MGYVDLRERGSDDPEVRVLRGDVGGPAPLLGWSDDGELAGLIAIERPADREVRLVDVFVRERSRRRGIGRTLVNALVAGAMADRFVARCRDDVLGFFEACGFAASTVRASIASFCSRRFRRHPRRCMP